MVPGKNRIPGVIAYFRNTSVITVLYGLNDFTMFSNF